MSFFVEDKPRLGTVRKRKVHFYVHFCLEVKILAHIVVNCKSRNIAQSFESSYPPCTPTRIAVRAVYSVRAVRCFVTSV